MKRVLYIGGFCMPDGNAAAQRVLGISKALKNAGCEVRLAGLTRSDKVSKTGIVDGFPYINYPYPASFISWLKYLTGRDASIAEIRAYQPDMIILYNHPSIAIEHITKYCHKNGIKVLADVTEWYEPQGNPLFKAIKGYDTNRRMLQSHLKVDGLICISSYLTEFYRKQGAKAIEIPPLVDIEQPKWHQTTKSVADEIRLIYAGSPGVVKDRLDLILEALDEIIPTIHKKIIFNIIGITREQYVNTWGDNKSRDYVVYNGRRPHEEVIKMLLEADFQIFLRPDNLANRAGFPTKFVETITSRTLPITNPSSNLEDYLINDKTGFVVQSLDKPSVKLAVIQALSLDRNSIESMKCNLDIDTFDYRRYASPLEAFIKKLN